MFNIRVGGKKPLKTEDGAYSCHQVGKAKIIVNKTKPFIYIVDPSGNSQRIDIEGA